MDSTSGRFTAARMAVSVATCGRLIAELEIPDAD